MSQSRVKNAVPVLASIAEHRVLTVSQVAALHFSSKQAARRRLAQLEKANYVSASARCFGPGQGRPERMFALTTRAVDVLKGKGILGADVDPIFATAAKLEHVEHQILINWVRIHFMAIPKVRQNLSVRFFASTSPFVTGHAGYPVLSTHVPVGNGDEEELIPDGACLITRDQPLNSLLFFLEADRSTEPTTSENRAGNSLHGKILRYQHYLAHGDYRQRYETIAGIRLVGFRLLFVVSEDDRLCGICNLARGIPLSDFVWVTSVQRLFANGIGARIWTRGGRREFPPQSILGEQLSFEERVSMLG